MAAPVARAARGPALGARSTSGAWAGNERYLAGEGEQWLRNAMDSATARAPSRCGRDATTGCGEPPPVHEDLPAPGRTGRPRWRRARGEPARPSLRRDRGRALADARAARRAAAMPAPEGGVPCGARRRRLAGGVPDRSRLVRPQRRHLRALGLLRRSCRARRRGARRAFSEGGGTLAVRLHRWDTGYWSRYDLFPASRANVASSFYHALHTLASSGDDPPVIAPRPEFEQAAERFEAYLASRVAQARAFARKVPFRSSSHGTGCSRTGFPGRVPTADAALPAMARQRTAGARQEAADDLAGRPGGQRRQHGEVHDRAERDLQRDQRQPGAGERPPASSSSRSSAYRAPAMQVAASAAGQISCSSRRSGMPVSLTIQINA